MKTLLAVACTLGLTGSASARESAAPASSGLEEELRAAEAAFAQTMAERDHESFRSYLAADAVFVGRTVLRGREAIAEGWKAYFQELDAPFSWRPATVIVLGTGDLGLTSGPVFDASGAPIGTFNSVWRRVGGGPWRIVLDKGCPACKCPSP